MSETTPTPYEKFRSLMKDVIAVPKAEIDRRELEYRKEREKKKREK